MYNILSTQMHLLMYSSLPSFNISSYPHAMMGVPEFPGDPKLFESSLSNGSHIIQLANVYAHYAVRQY